jgi:hypothetical protein
MVKAGDCLTVQVPPLGLQNPRFTIPFTKSSKH